MFYPLGDRPASEVSKRDVRELLAQVQKVAPIGVNRVRSTLRKMFGWAAKRDLIDASPVVDVDPLAKETSRERVLTDDELIRVWRSADALPAEQAAFIHLLILTAQRRGEVAGMRWCDINLETKVWTLPREQTKGDRSHEVPLSNATLVAINALPRGDGAYVLGSKPMSGFSKLKDRLERAMGEPLPDWRLHDLRRTAATGMSRLGVPVTTISRILNHTEGGVTKIYARYSFLAEKTTALDTWARHVEELVSTK